MISPIIKLAFAIISFISLLQPAMGQQKEHVIVDTLYSMLTPKIKLPDIDSTGIPRYQLLASCLTGAMNELIKKDEKCSNETGYYFHSTSINNKALIKISPVNLGRLSSANFFGYFIYCNRFFLCFGDKSEYLSAMKTTDVLKLRSYTSNERHYDDFYLGGDTDGALQQIICNGKTQYILLKSCNMKQKESRSRKRFH